MAISEAPGSAGPLVKPQYGSAAPARMAGDGDTCPRCGSRMEMNARGRSECPSCGYARPKLAKAFEFDIEVKAAVRKDGTLVLEGYASTWSKDRDGDTVAHEAFGKSLESYLDQNPILLLNHDRAKPIGQIVSAKSDDIGLKITAEVPKPEAGEEGWKHTAYRNIKRGILKALSIGGVFLRDTKAPEVIKEVDLYEISVVSVPSNPTSLFRVVGEKGLRWMAAAGLKADWGQKRTGAVVAGTPGLDTGPADVMANGASAGRLASPQDVDYRLAEDWAPGGASVKAACADCEFFNGNGVPCEKVNASVRPNMVCDLFEPADDGAKAAHPAEMSDGDLAAHMAAAHGGHKAASRADLDEAHYAQHGDGFPLAARHAHAEFAAEHPKAAAGDELPLEMPRPLLMAHLAADHSVDNILRDVGELAAEHAYYHSFGKSAHAHGAKGDRPGHEFRGNQYHGAGDLQGHASLAEHLARAHGVADEPADHHEAIHSVIHGHMSDPDSRFGAMARERETSVAAAHAPVGGTMGTFHDEGAYQRSLARNVLGKSAKGDRVGHDFHGNQWGGHGIEGGGHVVINTHDGHGVLDRAMFGRERPPVPSGSHMPKDRLAMHMLGTDHNHAGADERLRSWSHRGGQAIDPIAAMRMNLNTLRSIHDKEHQNMELGHSHSPAGKAAEGQGADHQYAQAKSADDMVKHLHDAHDVQASPIRVAAERGGLKALHAQLHGRTGFDDAVDSAVTGMKGAKAVGDDLDDDPGALAQGLDEVIDQVSDALVGNDLDTAKALVASAGATVDELLEALGVPDVDDDDSEEGKSARWRRAAKAAKRGKLPASFAAHRFGAKPKDGEGDGDEDDPKKAARTNVRTNRFRGGNANDPVVSDSEGDDENDPEDDPDKEKAARSNVRTNRFRGGNANDPVVSDSEGDDENDPEDDPKKKAAAPKGGKPASQRLADDESDNDDNDPNEDVDPDNSDDDNSDDYDDTDDDYQDQAARHSHDKVGGGALTHSHSGAMDSHRHNGAFPAKATKSAGPSRDRPDVQWGRRMEKAAADFRAKGGNESALLDYWREQMGGGEGKAGDFDACVDALSKHPDKIDDPEALCAWLHKQVTGATPGHAPAEEHNEKDVTTTNHKEDYVMAGFDEKDAPEVDDVKALRERVHQLEHVERERSMEREAEIKAAERLEDEEKAATAEAERRLGEEKRLSELVDAKIASMRGSARKFVHATSVADANAVASPGAKAAEDGTSLVSLLRRASKGDSEARTTLNDMSRKAAAEMGIKAIAEGASSAGYLVPPQYWQQGIAEYRLAAAKVRQLVTTIAGVNSNLVYIPRETGIAAVGWTAENAVKPSTDQVFGQIAVNIFTLAGISKVSNQLLEDSSPAVDMIVRKDLGRLLGQAEDVALLNGTGSGQPTGVLNTAGVLTGAIGGATYADAIATAISAIQSNYFGNPDGIVMHPRDVNKLRTAKDANGRYIFEPAFFAGASPHSGGALSFLAGAEAGGLGGGFSNYPSQGGPEGTVWGLPIYSDANMPSNLGAGTNETRIVVGAWKEAYLLERTGVTLDVSSEAGTAFESNQTFFRAEERIGATFARQPAAFYVVTGLVP